MNRLPPLTATVVSRAGHLEPRVELRVGGVALLERVREAEFPFARLEGVPALAGNYAWPLLTPRLVRLLAGEEDARDRMPGVLLNCECGWATCWPLRMRVRASDRSVTWHEFTQPKRAGRWSYASMEPMRFARAQYLEEIDALRAALDALRPSADRARVATRDAGTEECAL